MISEICQFLVILFIFIFQRFRISWSRDICLNTLHFFFLSIFDICNFPMLYISLASFEFLSPLPQNTYHQNDYPNQKHQYINNKSDDQRRTIVYYTVQHKEIKLKLVSTRATNKSLKLNNIKIFPTVMCNLIGKEIL